MFTLGIETSCDETSAAVLKDEKEILSNKISSSLELHKAYGGVVPEIACRHHVECINYVIEEAVQSAGIKYSDINLVAVTYGPGLTGALLVGVSAAKAISYSLSIPMVGVNHLYAHVYSSMLLTESVKFPVIGFIVSGGHTALVCFDAYNEFQLLGQTRDDAAGEAFDKVAKALQLGYPGGPIIEKQAEHGNALAIDFPKAYLEKGSLDFSFSGLKTSLIYFIRDNKKYNTQDICASFQRSVFEVLVDKAVHACLIKGAKSIFVGGGVSANNAFQNMLREKAQRNKIEIYFPQKDMQTDNAAMIAAAGHKLYTLGAVTSMDVDAQPNLGFTI